MQLRNARLCLDCEEVHEEMRCPTCASDAFSYITRWIPMADRRRQPRPTTSPEAETYRRLVEPREPRSGGRRLVQGGVLGLTAIGLAGWFFRKKDPRPTPPAPVEGGSGRADRS